MIAPFRILMGPCPLDIHPRVYQALASPVIGHNSDVGGGLEAGAEVLNA